MRLLRLPSKKHCYEISTNPDKLFLSNPKGPPRIKVKPQKSTKKVLKEISQDLDSGENQ